MRSLFSLSSLITGDFPHASLTLGMTSLQAWGPIGGSSDVQGLLVSQRWLQSSPPLGLLVSQRWLQSSPLSGGWLPCSQGTESERIIKGF